MATDLDSMTLEELEHLSLQITQRRDLLSAEHKRVQAAIERKLAAAKVLALNPKERAALAQALAQVLGVRGIESSEALGDAGVE